MGLFSKTSLVDITKEQKALLEGSGLGPLCQNIRSEKQKERLLAILETHQYFIEQISAETITVEDAEKTVRGLIRRYENRFHTKTRIPYCALSHISK